ncbi:MAG: hypothetical protein R2708_28585 [Vicinamibacterales bacterium]
MGRITARTSLTAEEVRRFNLALKRQVPARATVYLPMVPEFGADVTFWQRPPSAEIRRARRLPAARVGRRACGMTRNLEQVLQSHRRRFENTGTEEGQVMAATLAYVIGDLRTSRRAAILQEFRSSRQILELVQTGRGGAWRRR